VNEPSDFQGANGVGQTAGRTAPPVRSAASDQQPATKADLYAAVDAMRADMRELMEHVRELIRVADKRVTELERAQGELSERLAEDW